MRVGHGRLLPGFVVSVVVGVCALGESSLWARQAETGSATEDLPTLMSEGQVIFGSTCVACHDAEGAASSAPALSGHPSMGAKDHIVRQVLRGNVEKGMPPFAPTLTDRQVAAVTTYIRNAWDNSHGIVIEADARRVRAEPTSKP